MFRLRDVWQSYTALERRNMALYIGGIMFYKLGLEVFIGSIATLAADRFQAAHTFTKLGAAQGINQAAQCIGAILIAPLIKRWPIRTVLASAIFMFASMAIILLIVDASTGGKRKHADDAPPHYGSWPPDVIFVVWTFAGIAYGMVELIRRVIPADIVGGRVGKLRRMDAMVHIFYEIAGTAGALASSAAISAWGNNYSFLLTPIFFVCAGLLWVLISVLEQPGTRAEAQNSGYDPSNQNRKKINYLVQLAYDFVHFAESIWLGAKLVLGSRRFIWLFPSYTLALYLHRFLENSLATAYAKRTLAVSAWSQIIVGGSNFGELFGAVFVFVLSDYVTTPLPWLRLDALTLNLVWVLPHLSKIAKRDVSWAWRGAALFAPISFAWAAGDVSLAAYIQASLVRLDSAQSGVYTLGAVMAFLYSSYIVLYAILSSSLGDVMDRDFTDTGNITHALLQVGGIQCSASSVIIFAATFTPIGAFHLNPRVIGDFRLQGDPATPDNSVNVVVDTLSEVGMQPSMSQISQYRSHHELESIDVDGSSFADSEEPRARHSLSVRSGVLGNARASIDAEAS